jgi:hypothetical protein
VYFSSIAYSHPPLGNFQPPRVEFFLWLLSKNKHLTRDNLEKRKSLDDNTCVFCSEPESASHLLYECVVAKRACQLISETLNVQIGAGYE